MITRSNTNKTIVSQIEGILHKHFTSNEISEKGFPTVKYLAEKVNLSSSYLSDLLKKETGKNAQEHIHYFLIEAAKNILINSDKTVNEIAYNLGFEYPQYFNKLFKQKTGQTPMEFRNLS
jgi:AraC-like DNA-binding protein